jgi:ABC-type enterochelin transport system substrate-binding protein
MPFAKAVLAAGTAVSLSFSVSVHGEEQSSLQSEFFQKTVPDRVMEVQRGRAVLTIMDVDGNVQDNAAINNITGRNVITNGAFTNASGLSTTIQNSGNNVLIQNATILQLDVR